MPSASLWHSPPSTPRSAANRRIRSNQPRGVQHVSHAVSRAKEYSVGPSRAGSIQRPVTMLQAKRPLTEERARHTKEITSVGMRGSWVSTRPATQQEPRGRMLVPHPTRTPQSPLLKVVQPVIEVQVKTSVRSQAVDDMDMDVGHDRDVVAQRQTNHDVAAFPQRDQSSRLVSQAPCAILQLPLNHALRTTSISSPQLKAGPSNQPRPPNTARSARSTRLPFHMWGRVGDGELMSLGVKSQNRHPIRSGLATPRRNPRRPRHAGHQSRPSSVYDSTISHSQKVLHTVDGVQLLPSGQMREDPYHSLDDADIDPASSESIDLFEYFADAAEHTSARRGMRMKKVGLLACLEFLGYLQPQAKGRVPVLTSARRITPMEALDVFDSVLDCTSISDDEEEVKTV